MLMFHSCSITDESSITTSGDGRQRDVTDRAMQDTEPLKRQSLKFILVGNEELGLR